ncbi:MAG: hypothetical protein JNM88_11280 [Chitinophagaceae bacterium]|nr:hypothetical protein [Chitinophagaceae bacterium]
MKKFLLLSFLLASLQAMTQNVGVGTTTPNASAQLDVTSTTKGMLIPRMTQAQRTAITNPAQGLLVYQTDGTSGFYVNKSSIPAVPNWVTINEGINYWSAGLSPNSIYNNNTGNVGIGAATPQYPLTVQSNGIGISQQSSDASTQVGFFTTAGAAYLQTHTNHDLLFSTNNGAAQLTLKTGGNFGVGNTNPTNKLDVTGTFRATGNAVFGGTVQIQGGSPAAGRVLTSDASGNASWQAPDVPTCMLNTYEIFSALSYTNFTIPAGVTKVFVKMWGGGGNGSTTTSVILPNGGGGGGGAYASFFLDVVPGQTITGKINATNGSSFYTVFKYNGDSVKCNNGENANNVPGRGGVFLRFGLAWSATIGIEFYVGEDGKPNSFNNYTIGATSYTEYIGGSGGSSYPAYGQRGQVTLVTGVTESTKAELSTFKGMGAGGGAITRAGGASAGDRTGGEGKILIFY